MKDVAVPSSRLPTGRLASYLEIARFDHTTKHIFVIPGIVLALVLREPSLDGILLRVLLGAVSVVMIASANYVINEWLDREFDAYHPTKSKRASVRDSLDARFVYAEYFIFVAVGLLAAFALGPLFFVVSLLFLISGLLYNVPPFRLKDRVYVDVLSESLNNPLRLALGWVMVDPISLPPSSLLLCYWMGGAFLMGAKRLSEYRDIAAGPGVGVLHLYRRSFRAYTEERLLIACFMYANLASFFLAVFLIKYRVEYVIAFPFVALLFSIYLWLAFRKNSVAQRPERLFRSRRLMGTVGITAAVFVIMSFIDVPWLQALSIPHFIAIVKPGW